MTSKMSRNGTRITFNLFADSWYRMRNFFLPLRRLFPLRCLSYLSPHTSTWWLYLNVPPVKKELRRISSFSTIYPVCRLPQKISLVQFWNVLTGENHRAQQCLNQTVGENIAILTSELSVSWLQANLFTWNGHTDRSFLEPFLWQVWGFVGQRSQQMPGLLPVPLAL